jgi:integrase/recombinase XerD
MPPLAGLDKTIPPHKFRHFLFTWLKKQGIDDAMIQPYSGHASRQSLEAYSRLSLAVAQDVNTIRRSVNSLYDWV